MKIQEIIDLDLIEKKVIRNGSLFLIFGFLALISIIIFFISLFREFYLISIFYFLYFLGFKIFLIHFRIDMRYWDTKYYILKHFNKLESNKCKEVNENVINN